METIRIPFTDEERDTLLGLLAEFALAQGNPIREMVLKLKIKQHGLDVEERLERDVTALHEARSEFQASRGLLN